MTPVPPEGGVLPVDKPSGPTSHDVVARARRALDERKIGHTGTLDPFASGLLLLCVGPATRLSEYLTGLDKSYRARVLLGARTATHDPEGDVLEADERWRELERSTVESALEGLRGRIMQRPPAYSAKKIGGEAAHRRVRRGETVELEPVEVVVHELGLERFDLPELELSVRCSSGTYVRALARDLGEILGSGAHLTFLRRTSVGHFSVDAAVPVDDLDEVSAARAWISPAEALAHLPQLELDSDEVTRLGHGQRIDSPAPDLADGTMAALHDGHLVAVVEQRSGRIQPRKVFA